MLSPPWDRKPGSPPFCPEVSSEVRWEVAVEWQNATFDLFLQGQVASGRTEEQALALLQEAWSREDRERLEAWRRAARIFRRAG